MNSKAPYKFPSRVDEINADLLTAVLSERGTDVVVENFTLITTEQCGDGFASTADRVILGLDYAAGSGAGMPSRVLLKTMLLNPHAPEAMYKNEVRFYRDIRPQLNIETPQSYASLFDQETGQFGIIMEDLSVREARFPNATTQLSLEEITSLVKNLAKLHACFWDSPRFRQDLSWVPTPCSRGMFDVFDKIGLTLITTQVEKNAFKQALIEPIGLSLEQMWDAMWQVERSFEAYQPRTLLHGDTHIGNTYILPDGSGGLLDWQLMVMGCWAHDLAYVIVSGLETEVRRQHERDLISIYLDELSRCGVKQAPSPNEAWLLYRQAIIWGLVIGWLIHGA